MKDNKGLIMEEKKMCFRAIDPVLECNIVTPVEEDSKKGFWMWGANNDYPQYLNNLYNELVTSPLIGSNLSELKPFTISTIQFTISGTT